MSSLMNDTEENYIFSSSSNNIMSPFKTSSASSQQQPEIMETISTRRDPLPLGDVPLPTSLPIEEERVLAEKSLTIAALRSALAVLTRDNSNNIQTSTSFSSNMIESSSNTMSSQEGYPLMMPTKLSTSSSIEKVPESFTPVVTSYDEAFLVVAHDIVDEKVQSEMVKSLHDVDSSFSVTTSTKAAAAEEEKYSNNDVAGSLIINDEVKNMDIVKTKPSSLVEEILHAQKPITTYETEEENGIYLKTSVPLVYDEWTPRPSSEELENRIKEEEELAMFELLQKAAKRLNSLESNQNEVQNEEVQMMSNNNVLNNFSEEKVFENNKNSELLSSLINDEQSSDYQI